MIVQVRTLLQTTFLKQFAFCSRFKHLLSLVSPRNYWHWSSEHHYLHSIFLHNHISRPSITLHFYGVRSEMFRRTTFPCSCRQVKGNCCTKHLYFEVFDLPFFIRTIQHLSFFFDCKNRVAKWLVWKISHCLVKLWHAYFWLYFSVLLCSPAGCTYFTFFSLKNWCRQSKTYHWQWQDVWSVYTENVELSTPLKGNICLTISFPSSCLQQHYSQCVTAEIDCIHPLHA